MLTGTNEHDLFVRDRQKTACVTVRDVQELNTKLLFC